MNQDERGIGNPGGEKVAWFTGPGGNTLSVTQFHSTTFGERAGQAAVR